MKVIDLYNFINSFAPFNTAAEWDNPGLLCGNQDTDVNKILVALDVTKDEIIQAERNGCELIISHHPVIFHPQKSFLSGNVCYEAAKRNISIISAHTNLDKAIGGVNDTLCKVLKLDFRKEPETVGEGFLNTGYFSESFSTEAAAKFISSQLNANVRYIKTNKIIDKVAVCSGAGADLAFAAAEIGCNALITGDASYHDFLNAEECGITLFAAGHFETENIIVDELIKKLSGAFTDLIFIPSARKSPVITVN